MSEFDQGEESKSVFNSSFAILYRLDILWKDTHTHCRKGEYEKWNIDLDRIYSELYPDVKEEEDDEFEMLNAAIAEVGFKREVESGKLVNIHKLYILIFKKEKFLRKLQNKQGKGMAYEESIEDYMD